MKGDIQDFSQKSDEYDHLFPNMDEKAENCQKFTNFLYFF